MQENLSIVTAFYDINRANIKGFERNNEKYFKMFSFWAGLKNDLIIYTSEDLKDEILKIREKKGLGHKTTIITKDLESFDEEALRKIKFVFENYNQSKGRKNPKNIECVSAVYCYLMYLKPFFICDAYERNLLSDKALWLDFGFNHFDDYFNNEDDLNFELVANGGGAFTR